MMKELSFSTYFLRYILISTTLNVLLHASMLSMKHYLLSETQLQVRIKYDIITTIMLSSINIVKRLGLGLGTGNRESRIETVPVLTV